MKRLKNMIDNILMIFISIMIDMSNFILLPERFFFFTKWDYYIERINIVSNAPREALSCDLIAGRCETGNLTIRERRYICCKVTINFKFIDRFSRGSWNRIFAGRESRWFPGFTRINRNRWIQMPICNIGAHVACATSRIPISSGVGQLNYNRQTR